MRIHPNVRIHLYTILSLLTGVLPVTTANPNSTPDTTSSSAVVPTAPANPNLTPDTTSSSPVVPTAPTGAPHPSLSVSKNDLEEFTVYRVTEAAKERVYNWLHSWALAIGTFVVTIAALLGIGGYKTLSDVRDEVDRKVSDVVKKAVDQKTEDFKSYSKQFVDTVTDLKMNAKEAQAEVSRLQAANREIQKQFEASLENTRRDLEEKSKLLNATYDSVLVQMHSRSAGPSDFRVDVSASIGPIRNQGQHASVVGHMLAYLTRAAIQKQTGAAFEPSAEYIYVAAQKLNGSPLNFGSGMDVTDGFHALKVVGVVPVSSWPDGAEKAQGPLEPKYRLRRYELINYRGWDEFLKFAKDALSQGQPVLCTIPATPSFVGYSAGVLSISPSDDLSTTDFCTALVGIDEPRHVVRIANSWGEAWGDKGFGTISFSDFDRFLKADGGSYGVIREIEAIGK